MSTNDDSSLDLQRKRVVVVGLALTGVAVAKFAARRGANVVVTDGKPREQLVSQVAELDGCAELELGGHQQETFTSADYVIMSPGVPDLPETRAARAAGVPVIAEIELAYRFFHAQASLIAITGTNGKSTTTSLTGSLCSASGRPTFCGGNLGNHPLIEAVDHPANSPGGLIVAEVAGFMLETCTSFRPRVAALLNVSEDHLDRYGTMDVYAAMKSRVFRWQKPGDIAIANANDVRTMAAAQASAADLLVFDSQREVEQGAFLSADGGEIVVRFRGEHRFSTRHLPTVGTHNLENAMAAYLAATAVGVDRAAIEAGTKAFVPEPHRMARVAQKDGVTFFDDSKGTNVAAVAASMRGFPMPVVLIAGGVDKGGSYQPLFAALRDVGRGLVLLGRAAGLIADQAQKFGFDKPIEFASDMNDAVQRAFALAAPGTAVVLSPACASYDMFKNYVERGQAFVAAVLALGASASELD